MNRMTFRSAAKSNRVPIAVFLFSFVLYSYIAWCAPLTVDDLEFSGYHFTFPQMLEYVLYYGNGRFLGNLFALILVHSGFVQIALRAFAMASIIVLLPRTLSLRSDTAYLASFLLVTGMYPRIFAQVFSSLCTFGNYVPPILLTLVIVNFCRIAPKLSGIRLLLVHAVVFVLGTASQLYMEHNTLFNLFLAFLAVLHACCLKRSSRSLALTWFFAALLGGAIMFAIPKLFYIPDNLSVGYREFLGGSIGGMFRMIVDNAAALYDTLVSNHPAMLVLTLTALVLATGNRTWKSSAPVLALLALLSLLAYFFDLGFWDGSLAKVQKLLVMLRNLSLILFALAQIFTAAGRDQQKQILLLGLLFVVSLAPLLVVSPIGERLTFLAYLLFLGILLIGIELVLGMLDKRTIAALQKSLCALAIALSLMLTTLFSWISGLAAIRQAHLDAEMLTQPEQIHIFLIPSNYVLGGATVSYERRYFLEEWGDIEIIIDDINIWMAQYGHIYEGGH